LHAAQKKAGFPGRVFPERNMVGCLWRIGAIFLWAGRAKDSNDRRAHCRSQVHGAAIIADKKVTGSYLGGCLPETALPGQIQYLISWKAVSVQAS
jgi:hypothetical protein